jgi:hypothetical protein
MSNAVRAVTIHDYSLPETAPAIDAPDYRSWISRGANFAVVTTQAGAGALLTLPAALDESMILLPEARARIVSGAEEIVTEGGTTLVIAPPGPLEVHMLDDGLIVQLYSSRNTDIADMADNAALYRHGAPDCAPLGPGEPPLAGYRLRQYRLAEYPRSADNHFRIFRSENLMLNVLEPRAEVRDISALSPHSHGDFEQGSLAIGGRYIHHARYPWTKNMHEWRADEALEVGAPSLIVIPPGVIHTSRNIVPDGWLLDIFAPPRSDFLRRPGAVRNAADYPPVG